MDCIIIQYYVSDIKDQFILEKCIDSIKKTNLDIILVSHSPIPELIQKKVKYFIYDSDDQLLNFDDAQKYNLQMHSVKVYYTDVLNIYPFDFNMNDLAYTFYKALYTVYKFSHAMGYEYSYYFIGDFHIDENEINDMFNVSLRVKENNKMGYFEHDNIDSSGYSSLNPFFWYVNIKWFVENIFHDNISKDNYLKELKTPCFYEKIIFEKINNFKNDIIFEHNSNILENPIKFINKNNCDLSKRYRKKIPYDIDAGIFYKDDIPYIFSWNNTERVQKWKFIIEKSDNTIHKYTVSNNRNWSYMQIINIDEGSNIKCYDLNQDKLYYDITIKDLNIYKIRHGFHKNRIVTN